MKKKIIWLSVSFALILMTVLIFKVYMPRNIADSKIEEIVRVQANFDYGEEYSKLTDVHFIPKQIIECISKYKEQRTLTRHKGYAMKDVQMSILVRTSDGLKEIIIGRNTYSQKGSGPAYKILDGEKFKKEIFDACGYVEELPVNKGTTQQFGYNNLKIDVTNVFGTKTKRVSDGFDSWECAVYSVYPGARVMVKDADIWISDDGEKHSNWAFYKENDERIYITDKMDPFVITDDLIGIYDTESSVVVLEFEKIDIVKIYDATPEDKVSEHIKNGELCYSDTHYKMSDGTWKVKDLPYTYKYRLELTGRLHNAERDSTYIILSNRNDITFEQAWKASGLSSNTEDYFAIEDAIIVGRK